VTFSHPAQEKPVPLTFKGSLLEQIMKKTEGKCLTQVHLEMEAHS